MTSCDGRLRQNAGKRWRFHREAHAAIGLDSLWRVVEQEEKLGVMPIDSLIILPRLREERRLATGDWVPSVPKPGAQVRATLEKRVETGFLEPHGLGRGRTCTLSAALYQKARKQEESIRQAGFAPIQQEQMVLSYIDTHGSIRRADAANLCHIGLFQATRLLKRLE